MEDFVEIVGHFRRFKKATKGLNIDELVEVKTKLEKIIEDRIAAAEKEKQKNAEKIEKIEKIRAMMVAEGIEPSELVAEAPVQKGKRAPRPPKYAITDANGKKVTWTGQGRMPNVFKVRVDAGESIDKFLI